MLLHPYRITVSTPQARALTRLCGLDIRISSCLGRNKLLAFLADLLPVSGHGIGVDN